MLNADIARHLAFRASSLRVAGDDAPQLLDGCDVELGDSAARTPPWST